jgi:hypothetical protein
MAACIPMVGSAPSHPIQCDSDAPTLQRNVHHPLHPDDRRQRTALSHPIPLQNSSAGLSPASSHPGVTGQSISRIPFITFPPVSSHPGVAG